MSLEQGALKPVQFPRGQKGLDCQSFSKVSCTLQSRQGLTSKFMEIGGRAHFFLSLVGSSSISALIWDSFIPAIRFILSEKVQK